MVDVPNIPRAIEQAYQDLRRHKLVSKVSAVQSTAPGIWKIEIEILLALPSRTATAGITATGIKSTEVLQMVFTAKYPQCAPELFLRIDFPENTAHINPWKSSDGRLSPCIYEGHLENLLLSGHGISAVVDQAYTWFTNAANGTLIDPGQGWEPVRRETQYGLVTYDEEELRSFIIDNSAGAFFTCHYLPTVERFKFSGYFLENARWRSLDDVNFAEFDPRIQAGSSVKKCFGLLLWGGKKAISSNYKPDTAKKLSDLEAFAKEYGFQDKFTAKISDLIKASRSKLQGVELITVLLVLAVRRPFNLNSSSSSIELLNYSCELKISGDVGAQESAVSPLSHRHMNSANLFRQLSGTKLIAEKIHILGCGSVGSKIAMHLARSGIGEMTLIDTADFSPHNNARHALFDPSLIARKKVFLLQEALEKMKVSSRPLVKDIIYDEAMYSTALDKDDQIILIDCTANLAVRSALAHRSIAQNVRILTCGLYNNGTLGYCMIEGQKRSSRIDDLYVSLLSKSLEDDSVAEALSDTTITRQPVGQGCNSFTMQMSDSTLSIHTALMTEFIRKKLENGMPMEGVIFLSKFDRNTLAVQSEEINVAQTTTLSAGQWSIRILPSVVLSMSEIAKQYSPKEFGGVVLGRLNFAERVIHVTNLLDAPPDSSNSETEFILGTDGLEKRLEDTSMRSNNLIAYLGTWHSHPVGGEASVRDHKTLNRIQTLRGGLPTVCLVWTPEGVLPLTNLENWQ